MLLNINEKVKVKLTDRGHEILKEQHDVFYKKYPDMPPREYAKPPEDSLGWSTWQIWLLMNTFGEYMTISGELTFEACMCIPDEWL